MESPVTRLSSSSFFVEGKYTPESHWETVGGFTPTFSARAC